jgi:lipopolysaccharide transport system ATP-binding protein
MYVRLAFSVAAHLEPEILLVDEVLSVGDADFQKKCLGKMGEVAGEGRTVLFVSHNMGAVSKLCESAILLRNGLLVEWGPTADTIDKYLNEGIIHTRRVDLTDWPFRTGSGDAQFVNVSVMNSFGELADKFFIGDSLCVQFEIQSSRSIEKLRIAVEARDTSGLPIFLAADVDGNFRFDNIGKSEIVEMVLHDLRLYPDTYYLSLWMADVGYQTFDRVEDCIKFDVVQGGDLVMRRLPRSQAVIYTTPVWKRL